MTDLTLDDTDRAIVRGLLFHRWPFDMPAKEMAADRLVDIAARTKRLEPHVERFRGGLDAARQGHVRRSAVPPHGPPDGRLNPIPATGYPLPAKSRVLPEGGAG